MGRCNSGHAMKYPLWLLIGVLGLAACSTATAPATAAPPATAVVQPATPTSLPTVAATAAPTVAPTVATTTTDWVNTASVEGDLYVRGNPHAPIRLIDFSDFL